jgi:hypothetical protein
MVDIDMLEEHNEMELVGGLTLVWYLLKLELEFVPNKMLC